MENEPEIKRFPRGRAAFRWAAGLILNARLNRTWAGHPACDPPSQATMNEGPVKGCVPCCFPLFFLLSFLFDKNVFASRADIRNAASA